MTCYLWLILPLAISLYWSLFIVKYQTFIRDYSYPQGKLGEADTPYIFLEKAVRWAISDSEKKGYTNIILSDYLDNPKTFSQWYETKYIWQYVLHKDYKVNSAGETGYYLILHSDVLKGKNLANYAKFGPFVAFENKN